MVLPELIHPALWRATQLAQGRSQTITTGYPELSAHLPDGGWPLGHLIELIPLHPGCGELQLICPALRHTDAKKAVAFVHPPHPPQATAWQQWGQALERLLWIDTQTSHDTLWASEQILKHASCAALLCWLPQGRPESLRRLHLHAQTSDTLLFLFRPAHAARYASPAPLRLALAPAPNGLLVHIIKRRGPICETPIFISLPHPRPAHRGERVVAPSILSVSGSKHAIVDRRFSSPSSPGHRPTALV